MKNIFLNDSRGLTIITWDDLIKDIRDTTVFNPLCTSSNYYTIFKSFIISMLIGEEIVLLDSELHHTEISSLTEGAGIPGSELEITKKNLKRIKNRESLLKSLKDTSTNWQVTIFTSGTTGKPKRVSHRFDTIARNVIYSEKFSTAVWGFAYNPTHMAGIQVFLQALLNGSTIVRLSGLDPNTVAKELCESGITHISATPTFYRQLHAAKKAFPLITRVTTGGERLDQSMIQSLRELFPNARVRNIYALTETGSLFSSDNDLFTVKAEYANFVRLVNDELHIHRELLGKSMAQTHEWYSTGDIVEIVHASPLTIRFLTRKSDMINVGGDKVNPDEVADAIRQIIGVRDVRVFSRPSSVIGNIVCCEIERSDPELSESTIRIALRDSLQEFKIPRIIIFVDKLVIGRTGKLSKKER
jgi:acyl-CoA synthetase (AMP-forming)/AMP-acid ligase II